MWRLESGGYAATLIIADKIRARIISDARGARWHKYDENFKLIDSGVTASIKTGMEKLNG